MSLIMKNKTRQLLDLHPQQWRDDYIWRLAKRLNLSMRSRRKITQRFKGSRTKG